MVTCESLCRIGGDEFVLLSIKKNKEEMLNMLQNVNKQLAGMKLQYPASISFGAEKINNVNFEEFRKSIHNVDQQLYNMKREKKIIRS
jgi:diguanylate cyclase (GGDEF)-like protein